MRGMLWGAAALALAGCAETQKAADTTVAAARAQVNPTLSSSDAAFLTEAGRGGLAEIQFAQLARENGRSPAVKRFAAQLAADHGKANRELAALAGRKQIASPERIGAAQQAAFDDLALLHGAAFDRAYASAMVQDHQDDLALFRTEARDGTDPDVKAFAARQVPMLEAHLRMAEALPR